MKKPMIGVIPLIDIEKDSYWMLPGYLDGILKAGGIPAILPVTSDRKILEQIANWYDGFLFTGGHDVSPAIYGEQAAPFCGECCEIRDEMEQVLFPIVFEMDKPVLGICRGIQVINAILGGTLYQDLSMQCPSEVVHHQSSPYDVPVHAVKVVRDTPLHFLLKQDGISVNSYHHQAVKNLSSELQAMAYAPDGVIEAVYAPAKSYVWAVQWHPEFLKDENSQKIFGNFLTAVQESDTVVKD